MVFDAPIVNDVSWEFFVWPIVTLFAGNWALGIWVQIFGKKDNSWIDVMWSISFLLPNITVLILRS